jgi:ankyrin repeat protein
MFKQPQYSLSIAIKKKMTQRAKELIDSGEDLGQRDADGYTPLHTAIALKYHDIAQYLLEKGADPNAYHPHGWHAIHTATELQDPKSLKLLLKNKANPNLTIHNEKRQENGWNCLHKAASDGATEIAKILLDHGLDINSRTPDGQTPLMISLDYRKLEMMDLLIKKGADLSLKDKWGNNAKILAEESELDIPFKKAIVKHKILKELKKGENTIEI